MSRVISRALVLAALAALAHLIAGEQEASKAEVGDPGPCKCLPTDSPVCGWDGVTYNSGCAATCAGVEVMSDGPCSEANFGCAYQPFEDPVCGTNNETYSNTGQAFCSGAIIACKGKCPCDNDCPEARAPVCGSDGNTYGNKCDAESAGVDVSCSGECPCSICSCLSNFIPVCADDGLVYNNACLAVCSFAKVVPCNTTDVA